MSIKLTLPVDNTDTTIARAVARTAIQEIMYTTEMDPIEDIIYIQRGGVNLQAQDNAPGEALKLEVGDYIQVEYQELETDQFDYNRYQKEYPSIFRNSALGISLTPMHTKIQLELTVKYTAKSYSALTTWLHAFNRRLLDSTPTMYHDIVYNYTIPEEASAYIEQVWELTEKVAGYGYTLNQFLEQHFATNGVLVRRNASDTERALTINVKNSGCLGLFTQTPTIQQTGKEPPVSTIEFTYTVDYERVTAVVLECQFYIHNQLIDLTALRRFGDRRLHTDRHAGNLTFTQSVSTVTRNQYGVLDYPDDGTNTGDGWYPDITPEGVLSSTIIPIQLDLTNMADLLDLNQLTLFGFPSWLIPLMQANANLLTVFNAWPISIDMFEVNAKTIAIPVYVDANFHLITKIVPNPRNRYYVRIMVMTNLLRVNFTALQKDPPALTQLLTWINPNVKLNVIGNGTYVTSGSLWDALNLINNSDLIWWNTRTVQTTNLYVIKINSLPA